MLLWVGIFFGEWGSGYKAQAIEHGIKNPGQRGKRLKL